MSHSSLFLRYQWLFSYNRWLETMIQKSPMNSSGCTLDPWLLRPLLLLFWSCFLPVVLTQAKQNTIVSCCTAPGSSTPRFAFQATQLLESFDGHPSCHDPTSAAYSNLTIVPSLTRCTAVKKFLLFDWKIINLNQKMSFFRWKWLLRCN